MTTLGPPIRYHAVSMELAAYLDEHCVEMHILTDRGETVSVVCPTDSIFAVLRHIKRLGIACPEIATWRIARGDLSTKGASDRIASE